MSTSSSPEATGWISKFHIVLPDVARQRVLLVPSDAGEALPLLSVSDRLWVGKSYEIIRLLRERLGLAGNVTVLRYLRMDLNETEQWVRVWLVLEPHEEFAYPPLGGHWADRDGTAKVQMAEEEDRALLLDYLDGEAAGESVPLRAPWAKPGWFTSAARWMTDTLGTLGRMPIDSVQQYRNLGISSVLRVSTAAGLVYLKATAKLPLFINEGMLMTHLAQHFPDQIPRPLAVETNQNWMLLDDFGVDLRSQRPAAADLVEFCSQFGALQVQSAGMIDDLLAAGCRDRRMPVLSRQIAELAAHPLTALHTASDDLAKLHAALPALQERCALLGGYHLPDCLVHGDLHLGNVARNGRGYLF